MKALNLAGNIRAKNTEGTQKVSSRPSESDRTKILVRVFQLIAVCEFQLKSANGRAPSTSGSLRRDRLVFRSYSYKNRY